MGTFKINENSPKNGRKEETECSFGVISIGFHIKSVVPFSPDRRQGSNRATEQENSEKKKKKKQQMLHDYRLIIGSGNK